MAPECAAINFLAHLYLAGETEADAAGALLGDFVKGPLDSAWPVSVVAGIRLHRLIDRFTDSHPSWQASRARFPPALRRFAGVAVDVVYDHFLARSWARFHPLSLEQFAHASYAGIEVYARYFPPRLVRMFSYMVAEDWLTGYRDWPAIGRTLARMSMRSSRLSPLADTANAASGIYAELEADFLEFFPALSNYVAVVQRNEDWRARLAPRCR
ncbi:MAG: ACP phosphodiesterase [Pseudomonadota bacterium]